VVSCVAEALVTVFRHMSTRDDDIDFDFFDEPETVEATQRGRRLPRRDRSGGGGGGPKPPMRGPTGIAPLARLVGLIAIGIVLVVVIVSWVGSCQGRTKHDEYKGYADKMTVIAKGSAAVGKKFAQQFIAPGLKEADFESNLQQYAQQEQQAYTQAQQIRPPGPLRAVHQRALDALQLRAQGLASLGDTLARLAASKSKDATAASTALANQAQLLTASDVVWDQLYRLPATAILKQRNVTGVVIPDSNFVTNPDLVGTRSFGILYSRLVTGASTGGTPSGKHGDGLVSTRVQPQGLTLSENSPATVNVSADLAFVVTVENSGDFQEVNVPVTLTIDAGGTPIKKQQQIPVIQPAEQKTVTFTNFNLPTSAFGQRASVKVAVAPVAGEINTANNSATYTVFFTLSGP
jgi:hypothetical protein